jgi:hypothetical protein
MKVNKTDLIRTYFAGIRKKSYAKNRKEGPILANTEIAIVNSIKNRWLLNIYYDGLEEGPGGPGRRWIEPYVYGLSKFTGNHLLRAWQYQGATLSIVPGWKLFRADLIRGTAPLTSKTFNKPRILYNPDDEDMSSIIIAVSFPDIPSNEN